MYNDIKPELLTALKHGPLTIMELAIDIDHSEFLIRAELRELRRTGHVVEDVTDLKWRLTDAGTRKAFALFAAGTIIAWDAGQLRLG
jgi:predicted transcriptional regulator